MRKGLILVGLLLLTGAVLAGLYALYTTIAGDSVSRFSYDPTPIMVIITAIFFIATAYIYRAVYKK